MHTLQGIAAAPGVAIGEAFIIDYEGYRIPRRYVTSDAVESELERLDIAIHQVAIEIEKNRDRVNEALGGQYAAIFSAHLLMLKDELLRSELEKLIREQHHSPEYAVSCTLRRYAQVFENFDNSYLAERAQDLHDIERGLLRRLIGDRRENLTTLTSPVVILAHNLTPSETASLDHRFVLGFATEIGGAGGHTAIVAKGLEIPAAVGAHTLLAQVASGDLVIVDGDHGQVIVRPDEETIERYRHEAEEHRSLVTRLAALRDLPAETTDGVQVDLLANIEFPREAQVCLERGATGIGLYRTEFLYLGAKAEPTEEVHFQAYAEVIRQMQDRPVVIRTLDLGADKLGQLPTHEEERNPFLGLRSIRLSLKNLPLFRTQLRAILRASAMGHVHVMFPLIATLQELRQSKMVLADAMEDLDEKGVDFNRNIPVGMMVEVPSTVLMLERFLPEVDFISIGTNDLIQYALAVDRSNPEVADRYCASDPAVLQLLKMSLDAAQRAGVPAHVCGQVSSEPLYTMLLLGLGLRGLSVPPSTIPEVKNVCRRVSIGQCEAVAQRALDMDNAREIETFLREQLRKAVPDFTCN